MNTENKPRSRVLVVSGADAGFYDFLRDTVRSVEQVRPQIPEAFDLAVIDCGLAPEQIEELRGWGITLLTPMWPDFVPADLRLPKHAARFVRPRLPQMAPGYEIILWIDADAWVQDGRFFEEYVSKAQDGSLAIVLESEKAYKWQWHVFKWNVGNNLLSFGLIDGIRLSFAKPINNGLFALRSDAPHWKAWEHYYEIAVRKSGKFYSQLAMAAGLYLNHLPVKYTDGRFNWITSRGRPAFDEATGRLCLPYPGFAPLSVIHMAGPEKNALVPLDTAIGGVISRSLRWSASK